MTTDPNRPTVLLTVANEMEAAVIVNALAEHGVDAFATGGYTSGFKAEAPGDVQVVVKNADMERAQQALTQIRRSP
jgi:nitrogen regulatory protein PII-like uncharacterized protein